MTNVSSVERGLTLVFFSHRKERGTIKLHTISIERTAGGGERKRNPFTNQYNCIFNNQ